MPDKTPKQKESLQLRPPVVVVLGHVDHGKSSILEAIRDLKITEKESGGITQHIGAYEVEQRDKKITFIDTPGHEAFSAMRSRGARVADIAILVVAAEEGIKPQTKEAITHIKKAGIPMIVAINKIDKPGANPEKVKRELSQNDVLVESIGGKVPDVLTSAKEKKGLDDLLEMVLLVAELEELKGDVTNPGEGVVVEAYLDSQRGPTSTLLLRDGSLKKGDIVGTRSTLGKVKILENFQGKPEEQALLSAPCIMLGFEKVPQVGEKFKVYPNIESAQKYIEKKEKKTGEGQVLVVEEGKKVLNLILKADVQGSIEAIHEILKTLPQDKVVLRIIKGEVGDVQDSDLRLAQNSKARIVAFRVKTGAVAKGLAERESINIMTFDIIYELTQAVRLLMEKRVALENVKTDLGKLKVLIIFLSEKNRQIVGGKMTEGEIRKGAKLEVWRREEMMGRGRIINLQKNKKDIAKAKKGEECGLLYQGDVKIEEGDTLQIYVEEQIKGEL
ncbi:MAG: translation initiation factor IF-2 [Candidatus Nealsonbacteria bacterium]